jgi:cyclophilin family peptidyl-prolyl cis-trans isomerase
MNTTAKIILGLVVVVIIIVAIIFGVRAHHAAAPAVPPQTAAAATQTPTTTQTPMTYSTATFHTSMGDFTISLDNTDTPITAGNFEKLASQGFYSGVRFHRVIAGFMIQTGDPLSKDDSQKALWGTGGPGYTFNDEIKPATNKNVAGAVAMANSGPNTNGSQFFINLVDNDYLDPNYTVFGHVISGMDVVQAIGKVPTNPTNNQPLTDVTITSIDLK